LAFHPPPHLALRDNLRLRHRRKVRGIGIYHNLRPLPILLLLPLLMLLRHLLSPSIGIPNIRLPQSPRRSIS
jgi:hypothetical protein